MAVTEAQELIAAEEQKYSEALKLVSELEAGWAMLRSSQEEHRAALARLDDLDARESEVRKGEVRVSEESTILANLELGIQEQKAHLSELEEAARAAQGQADIIRSEWQRLKIDHAESLNLLDEQASKIDELKKSRTQSRCELKVVQDELESEVGLRKQARREAKAAQKALGQLETEHQELAVGHEKLKTDFREHKRSVEAEKREALEVAQNKFRKELEEAKSRGKAVPSPSSMTNLPLILELLRHYDMEAFPPTRTACTSGSTPWSEAEFDEGLRELGFEVYEFPNASEEIVVLGRDGWSKESIKQQIDLRGESALRFYSQELFLLGLMRGADPLEACNRDLLRLWHQEHPALRYLMSLDWSWPFITASESLNEAEDDAYIKEFGGEDPVHFMGYEVGIRGLYERDRRTILRRAMEDEFPASVLAEYSEEYLEKWGRPNLTKRLRRIAEHIAGLIRWQGKDWRKGVARQEWIDDLDWLKSTYYSRLKATFKWPETHAR